MALRPRAPRATKLCSPGGFSNWSSCATLKTSARVARVKHSAEVTPPTAKWTDEDDSGEDDPVLRELAETLSTCSVSSPQQQGAAAQFVVHRHQTNVRHTRKSAHLKLAVAQTRQHREEEERRAAEKQAAFRRHQLYGGAEGGGGGTGNEGGGDGTEREHRRQWWYTAEGTSRDRIQCILRDDVRGHASFRPAGTERTSKEPAGFDWSKRQRQSERRKVVAGHVDYHGRPTSDSGADDADCTPRSAKGSKPSTPPRQPVQLPLPPPPPPPPPPPDPQFEAVPGQRWPKTTSEREQGSQGGSLVGSTSNRYLRRTSADRRWWHSAVGAPADSIQHILRDDHYTGKHFRAGEETLPPRPLEPAGFVWEMPYDFEEDAPIPSGAAQVDASVAVAAETVEQPPWDLSRPGNSTWRDSGETRSPAEPPSDAVKVPRNRHPPKRRPSEVTLAKDQVNTPQKYRIRNAEKQVEAKEKKLKIFKELISANLVDLTAVLDRSDQQAADIRSLEVALREQEGVLAGQLSKIPSRSQQAVAGNEAAAVVDVDAHEAPPSYDACAAGEAPV